MNLNLFRGPRLSNKALRILIADEQHFNRMRIERLFNHLDYHRIAPAQNLAELLTLMEYGGVPFDVVVVNASMAGEKLNLIDLFLDSQQVRQTFIYACQSTDSASIRGRAAPDILLSHSAMPDLASLRQLMALVDPAQPFVGTVISVR
jgi:AmiR/NasT family two-component response regulator